VGILCYSPLCQGLLTGKYRSPDEVSPTLARTRIFDSRRPNCRHHGRGCEKEAFDAIGQIREICRGLGAPMGAVSLAWLLEQRGVTSVLAGGRTAAQVRQNAEAAELELPAADVKALSDATKKVKEILAANADMWQDDSRLEKPSR
jgi:aryl-alcohol dehydrogenase-like predicted oxidoreductase